MTVISIMVGDTENMLYINIISHHQAVLAEEKHANIFKDMEQNFPVQYIAGGATQNVNKECFHRRGLFTVFRNV